MDNNSLESLDKFGTHRWTIALNAKPLEAPSIDSENNIIVPCSDGSIYKYSSDGVLEWSYPADIDLSAAISVSMNDEIVTCNSAGTLLCVSSAGKLIWSVETGADIANSLSICSDPDGSINSVYFPSENGDVIAVQQSAVLWTMSLNSSLLTSFSLTNLGTACIASGRILFCFDRYGPPYIYEVQPTSGEIQQDVQFELVNAGNAATNWEWNFGQGAFPPVSQEESPHVTLSGAGLYSGNVTAENQYGSHSCDFEYTVIYAQDTLYVIPMKNTAFVDEPISIVVACGQTNNPFLYAYASVSWEAEGYFVADSFNAGAIGGYYDEVDGIWSLVNTSQLLVTDDYSNQEIQYSDNREYLNMGVVPITGQDTVGAHGDILNFSLAFSEPGVYRIGLIKDETYPNISFYRDSNNQDYIWSVFSTDDYGMPNIDYISNEIRVF